MFPLSEIQVFENLNKFFHEDFKQLQKTHLQSDEEIFAAYACSLNIPYHTNTEYSTSTYSKWGYLVITGYRGIMVSFPPENVNKVIYSKKNLDGTFFELVTGLRTDNRSFIFPRALDRLDSIKRVVEESLITNLLNISRKDHVVNYKGRSLELMEIGFGSRTYVTFEAEHGQDIYNLMQLAGKNGGKIPSNSSDPLSDVSSENIPDMLKKLHELHEAGVLADAEFLEKIKKLSSRL
jgi:hypothetical protein